MKREYVSEAAIVYALMDETRPVPDNVLDWLESEIEAGDCENWTDDVGRAVIARFRRESRQTTGDA